MNIISVVGIDLAKTILHLHGLTADGKTVVKKRVSRKELLVFIAQLSPCLVGLEACGGAHYWARKCKQYGHRVKLIAPQFVKPFVRGNKNDSNDAFGIAEAASRHSTPTVPIKAAAHQDISSIHCIRQRLMGSKTALTNQIRGLLMEYGVVIPVGTSSLRKKMVELINTLEEDVTPQFQNELSELYDELISLEKRLVTYDTKINSIVTQHESCQRLMKINGVGPLTATAILGAVTDARNFKNGRQMSAWLGLVPKQHSTGGKTVLLGISKRGDRYLRTLLIHGARAFLVSAHKRKDYRSQWAQTLRDKKGLNVAAVAMANKNARTIWAILANNTQFNVSHPYERLMKVS